VHQQLSISGKILSENARASTDHFDQTFQHVIAKLINMIEIAQDVSFGGIGCQYLGFRTPF
jgi:hypothetical protein